jgi:hypothetical protein
MPVPAWRFCLDVLLRVGVDSPLILLLYYGVLPGHRLWRAWPECIGCCRAPLVQQAAGIASVDRKACGLVVFILSGFVLSYPCFGDPGCGGRGCRTALAAAVVERRVRLGGLVVALLLLSCLLWTMHLCADREVVARTGFNAGFSGNWSGDLSATFVLKDLLVSPFDSGLKNTKVL